MTDDKKRSLDDVTAPVAIPPRVTGTDEADPRAFIGDHAVPSVLSGIDDDERTQATAQRPEGSSVRLRIPAGTSFDDEVVKSQVPARPARSPTPPVLPPKRDRERSAPQPVDVEGLGALSSQEGKFTPGDTNMFMRDVFAGKDEGGPIPPASRPDRVITKPLTPMPVIEAEEKTVMEEAPGPPAPLPVVEPLLATAPIMKAEDAESIPTAPIPMITGLNRNSFRDDEPSLTPRPEPTLVVPERVPDPAPIAGDGIERDAPAVAAPDDAAVEHTPVFIPLPDPVVTPQQGAESFVDAVAPFVAPSPLAAAVSAEAGFVAPAPARAPEPMPARSIANDDTSVRKLPKKGKAGVIIVVAAVVTVLVAGAVIIAALKLLPDLGAKAITSLPPVTTSPTPIVTDATAPKPAGDAPKHASDAPPTHAADATPDPAPHAADAMPDGDAPTANATTPHTADAPPAVDATVHAVEAASPTAHDGDLASPTHVVDAAHAADATPTPHAADATPAPHAATTTVAATPVAVRPPPRSADGFGPFVDRTGSGVEGAGGALGRAVRAIVGDGALADSTVGVRGELRKLNTSKKDKLLSVSLECSLVVFDKSGAHASLGAAARAGGVEGATRDTLVRQAAETCAKSLEGDLKAAVARAKQ